MLHKLILGGFKAFGERTEIELGKITLLYGQNSAGKSSIIQSLLLMKQTLEAHTARSDREDDVLVVRGPLTDLASFQALVYQHDTTRSVRLGVSFGEPRTPPRTMEFEYGLAQPSADDGEGDAGIRLLRLEYTDADGDLTFLRTIGEEALFALARESWVPFAERLRRVGSPNGAAGESELLNLVANGSASPLFRIDGPFPGEIVGVVGPNGFGYTTHDLEGAFFLDDMGSQAPPDRALLGVVDDLRQERPRDPAVDLWSRRTADLRVPYIRAFDAISYLGPMREPPQRLAILSTTHRSSLGFKGENAIQILAGRPDLKTKVNSILNTLGVKYRLAVVDYDETGTQDKGTSLVDVVGRVAGIQLTNQDTGVVVTPSDVGFGISQLLPIVIQISLRRQQVLCIEQPEIHLHPKLQAQLGEMFVESAEAGSDNQFIIETHSEGLMLRLQRLVREEKLEPDDVTVIYVDHDPDRRASRQQRLRLRRDGYFRDKWPQGFFEERYDER